MFNLFGKLFGTEKALDSVVKSAAAGLDSLIYTDQEKAEAAAQQRTEARQMVVAWMQATQGQNLARRLIALCITAVWLAMYLLAALASVLAVWVGGKEAEFHASAKIARELSADMNPAVMLILAFYFAAPHMGDLAKVAISKMSQKK